MSSIAGFSALPRYRLEQSSPSPEEKLLRLKKIADEMARVGAQRRGPEWKQFVAWSERIREELGR